VSRGASDSLLGMLAPVVMGTIAQSQGGRELDGRGVAGFLAGQKDNIAAALPSGFGKLLGGTGLLDSLGGAARGAGAAGTQAARAATSAAGDARRAEAAAPSSSWMYWAIPVAALAALAIYLLANPAPETVEQGANTVQSLNVGGVDVGRQMTDSIASLRMTLSGMTDAASAQSGLPALQQVSAQVDKVANMRAQMTAPQRTALAGVVSPEIRPLMDLSEKVLANPGVADVLKPTLDPLMAKLSALAT
jgi:hypothetical protein